MSRYPYDPPIDAGLSCRNCGDPILAVAAVFSGSLSINGLREFEWTHAHGDTTCQPKTMAQPFDGWQATSKVKAIEDARAAAEDALMDALDEALS